MKKKTLSADAAIQEVKRRAPLPPPAEALAELKKVVEYNDQQIAMQKRVSYQAAIEILRSHGCSVGLCFRSLNKLCQEHLGRKSWSRP